MHGLVMLCYLSCAWLISGVKAVSLLDVHDMLFSQKTYARDQFYSGCNLYIEALMQACEVCCDATCITSIDLSCPMLHHPG